MPRSSKSIRLKSGEDFEIFIESGPSTRERVVLRVGAGGLRFFPAGYTTGGAVAGQQTDISALTDNSGGTADNTIAAVEASYTQATLQNNFADLASQVNDIRTALRNLGLMA